MTTMDPLELGSRRSRHASRQKLNAAKHPTLWISVWIIASILPMLPYATPLWSYALADTPYAYLVWIPVFAFLWGALSLVQVPSYKDDAELNGITGLVIVALAASLLYEGTQAWAGSFVGNSAGLLIWPLWAMGLAWLIFGIGVTKRLIRPLLYLLLAWPPLYASIVNITNPLLDNLANTALHAISGTVSFVHTQASYGDYLIQYAHTWVPVQVSSVCSGSDSFLAMAILLPIILVIFHGTTMKNFLLISIAAMLSIVLNLLRLLLLIESLHVVGSNFTFGTLHPILGIILFVIAIGILAILGKSLGMKARSIQGHGFLHTPGWGRAGITAISTAVLTLLLWPIYSWATGSFGAPVPVNTSNLSAIMPNITNYTRSLLGSFNEAAILGPGAYGRAFAYSSVKGDYVMAEEWWTTNLSVLQSYGVNNCLLFHGYSILGRQQFSIRPGVQADAFAVLLPAAVAGGPRDAFEDVTYTYAATYQGKNAYIRAEFMTPIRYQVRPGDPILSVMPTALAQQYEPGASTASSSSGVQATALRIARASSEVGTESGGLSALSATERQHLQAFNAFVRDFAKLGMATSTSSASVLR